MKKDRITETDVIRETALTRQEVTGRLRVIKCTTINKYIMKT